MFVASCCTFWHGLTDLKIEEWFKLKTLLFNFKASNFLESFVSFDKVCEEFQLLLCLGRLACCFKCERFLQSGEIPDLVCTAGAVWAWNIRSTPVYNIYVAAPPPVALENTTLSRLILVSSFSTVVCAWVVHNDERGDSLCQSCRARKEHSPDLSSSVLCFWNLVLKHLLWRDFRGLQCKLCLLARCWIPFYMVCVPIEKLTC